MNDPQVEQGQQRLFIRTESTSDLATKVAEQLLEKGLNCLLISWFLSLLRTITRILAMPSTAARVQANIEPPCFCFDLTAALRSGFIFALSIREKVHISSGRYQRGLVIGSETLKRRLVGSCGRQSYLWWGWGVLLGSGRKAFLGRVVYWMAWECQSLTLWWTWFVLSVFGKSKLMTAIWNGRPSTLISPFVMWHKVYQNTIEESPFSVGELDYLLLHQSISEFP